MDSHGTPIVPAEIVAKLCDEMEEVKEMMTHNMELMQERDAKLAELKEHTKELQKATTELSETIDSGTGALHGDHHRSAASEHIKELVDEVQEAEKVMDKNMERLHERGERLDQIEKTLPGK
uniref:V-SNARE coiled-coil homology domain-containing protein n=1 Tax=Plectus sambesii TaxID=2011161 RepID=A0A914X0M4_9BILA